MDERIIQIEKIAKELFRCFGGVGGQSIPLQEHNRIKTELGKNILKLIKDYKTWYDEAYGDLDQ